MLAEADDAGDPATLRRLREACEMSVVAVEDRGAAGFDTVEDLGLGIGDRLERGEIAEMRDLDRGDDGDMRPGDRAELGELAGMVHAELEDAEIRLARHSRQRQRHAPLIVEAADGGVGQALARQRNPQRLLGPGLADAPSDADDPGMAAPPRRAAERRSPISSAPGQAARMAARMMSGCSLRGLSSVTMTLSARRCAIAPIIGRLPASRSPPQPKTTTRRPAT